MGRDRGVSAEERRRVLELCAEHGPSRRAIAAALGVTVSRVDNIITRHLSQDGQWAAAVATYRRRDSATQEARAADVAHAKGIGDVLELPPRPFAVPTPLLAPRRDDAPLTAFWSSDQHFPFQDARCLAVQLAIAADLQPDIFIAGGDGCDCWQISRFEKNPARTDSLQDSIDAYRAWLAQVRAVLPKAEIWALEGNHEERLTRLIWGLDGAARELPRLRVFQQTMTWPYLMQLDDIGVRWVPVRQQRHTAILPKLIAKHGNVVRKWAGYTARGEWEKYGRSGISGHTHRAAVFTHRDANGTATWIEGGCSCDLEPEYGTDFDWTQACVVLEWDASRRVLADTLVRIREGAALFRGRSYGDIAQGSLPGR